MNTSTPAVFVGGPRDGHSLILPDRPHTYFFAQAPSLLSILPTTTPDEITYMPFWKHVYTVKLADGWPSIDEQGRTRYEYKGMCR